VKVSKSFSELRRRLKIKGTTVFTPITAVNDWVLNLKLSQKDAENAKKLAQKDAENAMLKN
jgi:hypothetical protein